ncbi:MAG: DUF2254 domain-containing protein [Rhodospirillales bacterium]|nr:DUF2254 domain-containing protein [Rhodospirillales bacterium]
MRANWSNWYRLVSYCRSSLWIVPFFAILCEQVLIRITDRLNPMITWRFYDMDVNSAMAVLNAIVTLTLSLIVFTFGSMLVAIQVAGGQLTPRIIATTLLPNNVVRFSVGLFTFTMVYGIGTIGRIGQGLNHLAMAVTVVLGLLCIVSFLYLIDYAARLLRPVSIMTHVGESGLKVIESVYTRKRAKSLPPENRLQLPDRPHQLVYHRGSSGIVLAVNFDQLVAAAQRADCIIELVPHVGDFIAVDEPLFQVYGGEIADEDDLRATIALGSERTMEQDPMFAFRILVDIAIRALSPAINDPTTAVLGIDQLHRLLRKVGRRHTQDEHIKDASGVVRVVWRTPNWEDFVRLAIAEIRLCGAGNPQIARRLRAMIENLIQTLPERRHEALRLELDLLDRSIDRLYALPEDAAMARVADTQGLGASGTGTVENART